MYLSSFGNQTKRTSAFCSADASSTGDSSFLACVFAFTAISRSVDKLILCSIIFCFCCFECYDAPKLYQKTGQGKGNVNKATELKDELKKRGCEFFRWEELK